MRKKAEKTEIASTNVEKGEIVLYQPDGEVKLEVRVENETVWLTIDQMALLFDKSRSTINEHILNAISEKEIDKVESVRKIGNSDFSTKEQRIDFFVQASQTPTGGILATGTRFDGFVLIADLVKTAKHSVVFIDQFATVDVLKFAALRAKGVTAVIYSARITPEFKAAKDLHNKQYPGLDLKTMRTIHDRFLLVDDTVYHFGASFKDMGNEMTAYSVLSFVTPEEVIEKVKESTKKGDSPPSGE